jgi:deazaflavin-dependent oxidoreductase (nitroreductase family)
VNVTLVVTGRRTGERRSIPLYGFEDGHRIVIVGSRGGSSRNPAWVHNLRAEPRASIKVGGEVREIRASEVDGAERDRLWELVSEQFPLYRTYQARASRRIPLFVLEPAN